MDGGEEGVFGVEIGLGGRGMLACGCGCVLSCVRGDTYVVTY